MSNKITRFICKSIKFSNVNKEIFKKNKKIYNEIIVKNKQNAGISFHNSKTTLVNT